VVCGRVVSGAFVIPPKMRPSGPGLVDEEYRMTVDNSPVKFTPALPGQPVPEIRTIGGGRAERE
jgi:hypothetical protein